MRLVLDSNIWVDWLVFGDPGIEPLRRAHCAARIEIAIDAPCLDELAAVLAYPEFELDAGQQAEALAQACRIAVMVTRPPGLPTPELPRCTDTDDQKFVSLTHAAGAAWLITRDKALLKLDRRLRTFGMRAGKPADWAAAQSIAA